MFSSLSPSSVGMGLRCGEQFRRRYIMGEVIPPGVSAGRGRGFHKAVEVNFRHKILSGSDLPVSDLTDAARDAFVHAFRNGVHMARHEVSSRVGILNEMLNQTVRLTEVFRKDLAPKIQPEKVEIKLKADVGLSVPMVGRLDFTQAGHKLDDLKTAGRSWPKNKGSKELQPPFYAYLYGRNYGVFPRTFGYHILVYTPTGQIKKQRFNVRVDRKSIGAAMAKAGAVYRMAEAGMFPPADPGSWVCDEKWCGYWHTCPYVGNGAKAWI